MRVSVCTCVQSIIASFSYLTSATVMRTARTDESRLSRDRDTFRVHIAAQLLGQLPYPENSRGFARVIRSRPCLCTHRAPRREECRTGERTVVSREIPNINLDRERRNDIFTTNELKITFVQREILLSPHVYCVRRNTDFPFAFPFFPVNFSCVQTRARARLIYNFTFWIFTSSGFSLLFCARFSPFFIYHPLGKYRR